MLKEKNKNIRHRLFYTAKSICFLRYFFCQPEDTIIKYTRQKEYNETMKHILSSWLNDLFLICFGGTFYYLLEILVRERSHYSMILCGGLAFYSASLINRFFESRLFLITRMILSALVITQIELCFGLFFNLFLHQHVWDYSTHLIQYQGQICLSFSILWFFLSLPLFWLEKFFRRHLFADYIL